MQTTNDTLLNERELIGPFTSKSNNKCTHCNGGIYQGKTSIYFYKQRRTKLEIAQGIGKKGAIVLHVGCVDLWMSVQSEKWTTKKAVSWQQRAIQGSATITPATISEDVSTVNVEQTITPIQVETVSIKGNDLASTIANAVLPIIQGKLDQKLDVNQVIDIASEVVNEALKGFKSPVHRIEISNTETGTVTDMGLQHKQFPLLLKALKAKDHKGNRLNFWIAGSAGTGKTSAAEFAAKALGLDFAFIPSLTDACELFGYESPIDHTYKETAFYRTWKNGGVHLWDDFDGSDSNAAIRANAALANGIMTFPNGETIKRHKDCLLILTANTWGYGATADYVGRNKQDAAFLDRFIKIKWEIDEELEMTTAGNPEWVSYVQTVRKNVKKMQLKVLVTPRASYFGAALLAENFTFDETIEMVLKNGMSNEQWDAVKGVR